MLKITISLTYVYYRELSLNDALTVDYDIALYQSMHHCDASIMICDYR